MCWIKTGVFAPIICAVPFRKNKIETKDQKKKKKGREKGGKGGKQKWKTNRI